MDGRQHVGSPEVICLDDSPVLRSEPTRQRVVGSSENHFRSKRDSSEMDDCIIVGTKPGGSDDSRIPNRRNVRASTHVSPRRTRMRRSEMSQPSPPSRQQEQPWQAPMDDAEPEAPQFYFDSIYSRYPLRHQHAHHHHFPAPMYPAMQPFAPLHPLPHAWAPPAYMGAYTFPTFMSPPAAMFHPAPFAMETASYEQLLALDDRLVAPGLSAEALAMHTSTQMVREEDAGRLAQQHGRCVICLDAFEAGSTVRRLPCLCVFHVDCADRHFQQSTTCPVCRTSVVAS